VGFITAGGEPLFFGFFDTADRGAIDTIWQRYGFAKLYRVLPKGLELR